MGNKVSIDKVKYDLNERITKELYEIPDKLEFDG